MTTHINMWGRSLGIRIPKNVAKQTGLQEGASVRVFARGKQIIIEPSAPQYNLADLLSEIREDTVHEEFELGASQGAEVW